jgi:hypothetical protein
VRRILFSGELWRILHSTKREKRIDRRRKRDSKTGEKRGILFSSLEENEEKMRGYWVERQNPQKLEKAYEPCIHIFDQK